MIFGDINIIILLRHGFSKKIENIFVKTYLPHILQEINHVFNAKKQALKLFAFQTSRQKIMEMI